MSHPWCLLILFPMISLVISQTTNESKCTYTFTVPLEYFESQCMTYELRSNLEEIRRENNQITKENARLKDKIENLTREYGDMVETVRRLDEETSNWRKIVEWPSYDTPFAPENIKDVIIDQNKYEDCYKAIRKGSGKEGIYTLQPKNAKQSFPAYCDEEGWTILERRLDGEVDFYRDWSDYTGGFGNLAGEFWLGLEKMFMLTNSKKFQFRVEALGHNDKLYTAAHDYFNVEDELSGYRLTIGNMTSGNSEDLMTGLNDLMFTTKDRDHDNWYQDNCAAIYRGGWWLDKCGWDPNREWCDAEGCMSWGKTWIQSIQLMIRPMAAKGQEMSKVAKTKPANIKKPVAKKGKPNKLKKPKQKLKGKRGQNGYF